MGLMLSSIVIALLFAWLLTLSFVVAKSRNHYTRLVKDTKHQHIDEILDRLLKNDEMMLGEHRTVSETIRSLQSEVAGHIQKVGMVRFNPFGKSGGTDQSFVLVLLNKHNTGVVLNFVYTHDGVRVYSKHVKNGKGAEYQLTQEEQHAIEQSL